MFPQTPNNHLNGKGCPKCGIIARIAKSVSNTQIFIEKSNIIHKNKYDYSNVNYINNHTVVEIICRKHDGFPQTPANHLAGKGCLRCVNNNISKMETEWLEYLKVPRSMHQATLIINNKKIRVDAFDMTTNTVYEFHGDFWHGNPKLYKSDDINFRNKKTFGELFKATNEREKLIRKAGYKLITIWEADFKKLKKKLNKIAIKNKKSKKRSP